MINIFALSWCKLKNMRILAIAKGTDILLFNADSKSTIRRANAHRNAITELCWFHYSSVLISCSLDGSIKSWDIGDSQILPKRTIYQHFDGIFGMDVSPNDMILIVMQRVPGVRDIMYESKKASTQVHVISLEGFESKVENIVNKISTLTSQTTLWDVKNVVFRDAPRYISVMNALQQIYMSSCAGMDANSEESISQKMMFVNNLIFANSFAYDFLKLHPDNAEVLTQLAANDHEVKQIYVYKAISTFLSSNTKVESLQPLERLSLVLMADWITKHHTQMFQPLLALAERIYSALGFKDEHKLLLTILRKTNMDTEVVLNDREQCPFCQIGVGINLFERFTCSKGHSLARCSRSFLVINTPKVWSCGGCQRKSHIFKTEDPKRTDSSNFEWLRSNDRAPNCPFCGCTFYILKFASFVKTVRAIK